MSNSDILTIIQGLRAHLDALEAMVVGGGVAKVPSAPAVPKPKKTLSPEHLAKMAAGRKAAAERRKAEKAESEASSQASEPEAKPKKTLSPEHLAKMAEGRKKSAERKKAEMEAAVAAGDVDSALVKKSVKGKKILLNKVTGACYKRIGESEKGEYLGVLKDGLIDTTVAE